MSNTGYVREPHETHIFLCSWTLSGKKHTYRFIYSGHIIDGIIACYENVLWSGVPDFTVDLEEARVT